MTNVACLVLETQQTSQQDFYTWESLGTLAIAAGAVVVVANTARTLLRVASPWVPFLISLLVTLAGAYGASRLESLPDWVIVILNSCLLFCTATGANQALNAAAPQAEGEARPYGKLHIKWLSPWFRK